MSYTQGATVWMNTVLWKKKSCTMEGTSYIPWLLMRYIREFMRPLPLWNLCGNHARWNIIIIIHGHCYTVDVGVPQTTHSMWNPIHYSLFTLREPRSTLILNREWCFLRVNWLYFPPEMHHPWYTLRNNSGWQKTLSHVLWPEYVSFVIYRLL